jgi:hypothetical protein
MVVIHDGSWEMLTKLTFEAIPIYEGTANCASSRVRVEEQGPSAKCTPLPGVNRAGVYYLARQYHLPVVNAFHNAPTFNPVIQETRFR